MRDDVPAGPVACLACITCLIVLLWFGYVVWSVVVVIESSNLSNATQCASPVFGYQVNVWFFCLCAVILMPLLGALLGLLRSAMSETRTAQVAQQAPGFLSLLMAILGIHLWIHLTPECEQYYSTEDPSLLLVFKINVVLLAIGFMGTICMLCLMVVGVGAILGIVQSEAPDRYENIPDSMAEEAARMAQASNLPPTADYV